MKKMLYRLSLLAILGSLIFPALAAADPARAAPGTDRGFLAFLTALQTPAPMTAASKGKGPSGGVTENTCDIWWCVARAEACQRQCAPCNMTFDCNETCCYDYCECHYWSCNP